MSKSNREKEKCEKAIKLCTPAFINWQEKVEAFTPPHASNNYRVLLLPHKSRKQEDEYMGIIPTFIHQKKQIWKFDLYATTGHQRSPPIILCSGDNPLDLLPDPKDGIILKRHGIRIRLEHCTILPNDSNKKGPSLPSLKPGNCYLDDEIHCGGDKWYDTWNYDNISDKEMLNDTIGGLIGKNINKFSEEIKKLKETRNFCNQTLDGFAEYAKDVYGIEKRKRKRGGD